MTPTIFSPLILEDSESLNLAESDDRSPEKATNSMATDKDSSLMQRQKNTESMPSFSRRFQR